MVGVSLNQREKRICPRLNLHNSADKLNRFVIDTHRNIRKEESNKKKEVKQIKQKAKDIFEKDIKEIEKQEKHFRPVDSKESSKECTTKHLSRILSSFDEPELANRQISITEIRDFTLLANNLINDGLKFLVRFKIIKEINDKGRYFYSK